MVNPHGAQYEAMANDDDYDPRKPEYIIPATEDEMTHTSTELLSKQIAQLEDLVERRQAESNPKTYQHYEQVIAEMRYDVGIRTGNSRNKHVRIRSDPVKRPDEPVNNSPRTFTHARIRSAPAPASSCDIVPPDDIPPCANRVHGSRPLHSPGEQLATRNFICTSLLRPPVMLGVSLPRLTPNPSKVPHREVTRGPGPTATIPSQLLRPSPGASFKVASRSHFVVAL